MLRPEAAPRLKSGGWFTAATRDHWPVEGKNNSILNFEA
jgi:hypothetical protein